MIRRSIALAVLLLLVSMAYNAGALWRKSQSRPLQASSDESVASGQLNASVDPREVVRTQMAALAQCQTNPDALGQVYALAAPANKAAVGPIDRFAQMLLSPKFLPLVERSHAVIGQPVLHEPWATVMVTTMDHEHGVSVFHFYLERQTDGPNAGCWMTFGVEADPSLAAETPYAATGV